MDTRLDRVLRSPVVARWIDRTHHLEVTGPTGSGKTTALLPIAVQDLVNCHTVAVEEIYGDFGTSLIPYAIALGRPVFVLDPSLEGSLGWNLLAGEGDEEVVEHFASVVEGLFVHHFYGPFNGHVARGFARLAREYARHKGGEADLALFKLLLSDRKFLYRVLNVQVEGSGYDKTETVGAKWISRDTRSWFDSAYLRWSEKLRIDYMTGLQAWVEKMLATAAARRSLCPGPRDLTLDLRAALSTLGALIVLRFPVQAVNEKPAHAMARFALKTLQDLTLRRFPDAFGMWTPVPPLSLFLDELPTLVGRDLGDATTTAQYMALVRKQGVSVTVCHQGGALIGDVLAGTLDTNARTKLFAPGLGADDLLRAQRATWATRRRRSTTREKPTLACSPPGLIPARMERVRSGRRESARTNSSSRPLATGSTCLSGASSSTHRSASACARYHRPKSSPTRPGTGSDASQGQRRKPCSQPSRPSPTNAEKEATTT